MNRRRNALVMLAACAAAPFIAFAQQQSKIWRVGFLGTRRPVSLDTDAYGSFGRGMRELGYVENKNLIIEWRFSEDKQSQLSVYAKELVKLNVDAIVTSASRNTRAAKQATSTIPIVMVNVADPVRLGFVASLARPGGNVTGITNVLEDLASKHLELLATVVPKLRLVAFLENPESASTELALKNIQARARQIGTSALPLGATNVAMIEHAFATLAERKPGALIVNSNGIFNQQRKLIADLALKLKLPSITVISEYAEVGGLMAYGPSYAENYRRAATYVDKILKGAKPSELPVEEPTKFEFVVNMKTAKAIGVVMPATVLARADRVIE